MSGSKLDQIVKGAPVPGTSVPIVISRSPSPTPQLATTDSGTLGTAISLPPFDPLSIVPSSPPQIYLNLIILEASLRSQYLTLRARRRQHTFFLLVLTIWTTCFFYALFLRPREDGSGVGGSVYWVVEIAEKVALMGGIVTGILIWGTGQWDRGIRWPRRWVGVANRGLRNINAKIVVIKGSWWQEVSGLCAFLFPHWSFFSSQDSCFHDMSVPIEKNGSLDGSLRLDDDDDDDNDDDDNERLHGEDLSPGGDFIKLLLLPKPFSADFRENWEIYRIEFWEKENERRATLRRQIKRREKKYVQEPDGWFWWAGWRGQHSARDIYHKHKIAYNMKRQRSVSRSESHSRTTSRSSTPANPDVDERPTSIRIRRGSSNASGSERRRKIKNLGSSDNSQVFKLTRMKSQSNL